MRGTTKPVRLAMVAAVLAATGALTATFVSGGGKGTADAATSLDQYVAIEKVRPNVTVVRPRAGASTGRFTVDCGTNRIGKFSPDNPVAQPGIKNGAEHLHDFVGNIAITANSSDAELARSGTTCRNGDRSSYFWPVVRIDRSVRDPRQVRAVLAQTRPTVSCPPVRNASARTRATLDRLTADADRQLARGIDVARTNRVLDELRARRAQLVAVSLADCDVSYDDMHAAMHSMAPAAAAAPSALPDPSGRNQELPGNTGGILRPASVLIEYRGNPTAKVVAMPRFLRALTGDAKPTSRGPANARATWTCSGVTDRLADRYPICPAGRTVQRVQDFPGCWDGKNIDSANHRSHVAFADTRTGACPTGFRAIPQLRITLSYAIPRNVQLRGQFALDSFPEEDHNPFSDHNDFVNVNSTGTMNRMVSCLNTGRACR